LKSYEAVQTNTQQVLYQLHQCYC